MNAPNTLEIYTDGAARGNPGPGGYGVVMIWKGIRKNKKNRDLWLRFLEVYKKHNIRLVWVKGHASNAGNNRCDELATEAADKWPVHVDEWYEQNRE